MCALTATDELCSTPFSFRFMTGAPSSLPTTLRSFLSLSVLQNGVHEIASSLAHVIATFVLSCLASPCP